MPYAPPHACSRCGHPTPKNQRCPCKPPWEGSTHPDNDTTMRQLRTAKLAANPFCEHPACPRLADDVDHITPLAEGGSRYDWDNLQSLCHPHHVQKTTQDALRGKTRAR